MSVDLSGLIEMLLVFGVAVAWGIAELILLRRAQRRDDERLPKD